MEDGFVISDIFFHGNYIDIVLDSGDSNGFKVSKKCLKYSDSIRNLIGIHIFDQLAIDSILKSFIFNRCVCMELSIIFLNLASIYRGVQIFEYISDEYYLPYVVVSANGYNVICNDYCYINDFFEFLDNCSWNVDISDINLVSSKYNLCILDDIEYIDIRDFFTITDVLDRIDLFECLMICGGDIVFDLAVSLGIKYVLLDRNSNINRFFDIIKYLDV